jgi:choline dehydrogenase
VRADLVVLAAGAYMSPAILQRSGIGPENDVARLRAPTVVPLPGVGQNLLEHPWACVTFAPTAKLDVATPDVLPSLLLKARSSRCQAEHWDTHVLPGIWISSDGSRLELTFDIWAVESDSTGRVTALSSHPETLPALEQPFSALSEHDVAVLTEGIELASAPGEHTRLGPAPG